MPVTSAMAVVVAERLNLWLRQASQLMEQFPQMVPTALGPLMVLEAEPVVLYGCKRRRC